MTNYSKLPHPIRIKCNDEFESALRVKDRGLDRIFEDVELNQITLDNMCSIFSKAHPGIIKDKLREGMTYHEIMTSFSCEALPYKYRTKGGNIFTISDELNQLMEYTDIDDNIPMHLLAPPFPDCFIEFGENKNSSNMLYSPESGSHILEGVYINPAIKNTGNWLFMLYSFSWKRLIQENYQLIHYTNSENSQPVCAVKA